MLEQWLLEGLKAIGKFFLNPLIYWSFILLFMSGYQRVRLERKKFGIKIFDIFSENKNTGIVSILIGLLISLITIGSGFVFSYETILLLSIVVILLSLHAKFTLLSASYTLGITYILLFLSPVLLDFQSYVNPDIFGQVNFTGIVLLLGLFLMVEAFLIGRIKRNETFPTLSLGKRGYWIGQHHLKKLSIIPFFVLIPTGAITPFADFWPYFSIGGETYSLLLVPFLIGFDYIVQGSLPKDAAQRLSKSLYILGFTIIIFAAGSIFITWLSIIAVLLAIIGREFIQYKHRTTDQSEVAYFGPIASGLKVLQVIPGTPGSRLGILAGEIITKVNGQQINDVKEFYVALQESGAYFKLDIIDDAGEIRFVQGALYEGDHHKLGLIFTDIPKHKQFL